MQQQTTLAWCQKAAEQGLPSAQVALAEMYRRGNGVAEDTVTAYMWYLVSEKINAEQKDEISAAKRQIRWLITTPPPLNLAATKGYLNTRVSHFG